jgi:transcriptional regulator with XRE-family HTH domain
VNPFSKILHELRTSRGLRQEELANLVSCNQKYISALETGAKPPPHAYFLKATAEALRLNEEDKNRLWAAAEASKRKYVIPIDASEDFYLFMKELWGELESMHPFHLASLRNQLMLPSKLRYEAKPHVERIKRRRKEAPEM